jgi:2-polyprenyl-3-methyl-5-hydroxy-6-metoxy-1,4-benzoquinol methylase
MTDWSNRLVDQVLALTPSGDIAKTEEMFGGHERHYFGVGRSAIMCIATVLACRMAYRSGEQTPRTILDFGAGHGRVARYLRVAFPGARVEVTDYNQAGVAWCIENLGCYRMGDKLPSDYYDLIWVGSVITHLPEAVAIDLITTFKRALRPMGVLVITAAGRFGLAHLTGFASGHTDREYKSYGLAVEGAANIVAGYSATGHGYHDYPNQTGYGVALITPEWMARHALDELTVQLLFQEMGWDTHQDVYAFMRTNKDGMFGLSKGRYF